MRYSIRNQIKLNLALFNNKKRIKLDKPLWIWRSPSDDLLHIIGYNCLLESLRLLLLLFLFCQLFCQTWIGPFCTWKSCKHLLQADFELKPIKIEIKVKKNHVFPSRFSFSFSLKSIKLTFHTMIIIMKKSHLYI